MARGPTRSRIGAWITTRRTIYATTVTDCSPGAGVATDSVTLTGTGFRSGCSVRFGGVAATSVSVTNDATLTCTVPAGTGLVDITVANITGPAGTLDDGWEYVASGANTVSGTVSLFGGAALASCGKVELYSSGGGVVDTVAVDGSGVYSFADVVNGTYYVMLHPSNSYCIHAGDAGATSTAHPITYADQPSVVVSNNSPTHNFDVDEKDFHVDAEEFADTTALVSTSTGWGAAAGGTPTFTVGTGGTLTLDATGGPSSTKAMKYAYPDNNASTTYGPNGACVSGPPTCCNSFSIHNNTFFTPKPTSSTWYISWLDKLSLNFHNAHAGCTGENKDYKYGLFWLDSTSGLTEVYLGIVNGFTPYQFNFILYDGTHGSLEAAQSNNGCVYPAAAPAACKATLAASSAWTNVYHRIVIELYGLTSSPQGGRVYVDGVYTMELQSTGSKNISNCLGRFNFAQWGANMNSGPDQAESRWMRQASISKTRPAMLATVT